MPVFSDAVPAPAAGLRTFINAGCRGVNPLRVDPRPFCVPRVSGQLFASRQASEHQGSSSAPLFGDEARDDFGEHLRDAGCRGRAGQSVLDASGGAGACCFTVQVDGERANGGEGTAF